MCNSHVKYNVAVCWLDRQIVLCLLIIINAKNSKYQQKRYYAAHLRSVKEVVLSNITFV